MNDDEWKAFLAMVTEDALGSGGFTEEKMNAMEAFKKNPANLARCQELLKTGGVEKAVLCFASDSIYRMTEIACPSVWSGVFCLNLDKWCIECMKALIGQVPDVVLKDLSRCVAKISIDFKMSYDFMAVFQQVGELMAAGQAGVRIALMIYDEFIAEMNRRVRRGLEAVHMETLLICLKNEVLPLIFHAGLELVRQYKESNNADIGVLCKDALVVCRQCLTFTEKRTQSEDWKKVDAPALLKETVSDVGTMQLFFDVYCANPMNEVLKVVDAIVCLSDNSFSSNSPVEVFGAILIGLKDIIQQNVGLDNETNRLWIAIIANVLGQRIKANVIATMPFFEEFLRAFGDYTQRVFGTLTGALQNESFIHCLLSFWTSMSTTAKAMEPGSCQQAIFELSAAVCNSYLDFLDGLSGRSEELSKEILGQGKVSTFVTCLRNLIFPNIRNLGPIILSQAQKRQTELREAIAAANEENTRISESHLCLLAHIMTDLLGKGRTPRDSEIMMFHPQFLASLVEISQRTSEWIGSAPVFLLEQSVLLFVGMFSVTVFGTDGAISRALYQQFAKLGEKFSQVASPDAMKVFLFNQITTALRVSNAPDDMLNVAISALEKLKPPPRLLQEMVENQGESIFPFLASPDYAGIRRDFYHALTVNILDDANFYLLRPFLESFTKLFESQEPVSICKLALDLRGILTAVKKDGHYGTVFDWLFPDKSMVFVNAMQSAADNPLLSSTVLKMWRSLVASSACGTTRIKFPPYSANGTILFKTSADVLMPYITFLATAPLPPNADIHAAKYQGFRRCCEILDYLVTLDCIAFDAFEIYNDPVFHNLLKALVDLIRTFNPSSLFQYPKVAETMMLLFKDLCHRHTARLIRADPAFLPDLIQLSFASLDSSQKPIRSLSSDILTDLADFFADPDNSDITSLVGANAPEAIRRLSAFYESKSGTP